MSTLSPRRYWSRASAALAATPHMTMRIIGLMLLQAIPFFGQLVLLCYLVRWASGPLRGDAPSLPRSYFGIGLPGYWAGGIVALIASIVYAVLFSVFYMGALFLIDRSSIVLDASQAPYIFLATFVFILGNLLLCYLWAAGIAMAGASGSLADAFRWPTMVRAMLGNPWGSIKVLVQRLLLGCVLCAVFMTCAVLLMLPLFVSLSGLAFCGLIETSGLELSAHYAQVIHGDAVVYSTATIIVVALVSVLASIAVSILDLIALRAFGEWFARCMRGCARVTDSAPAKVHVSAKAATGDADPERVAKRRRWGLSEADDTVVDFSDLADASMVDLEVVDKPIMEHWRQSRAGSDADSIEVDVVPSGRAAPCVKVASDAQDVSPRLSSPFGVSFLCCFLSLCAAIGLAAVGIFMLDGWLQSTVIYDAFMNLFANPFTVSGQLIDLGGLAEAIGEAFRHLTGDAVPAPFVA